MRIACHRERYFPLFAVLLLLSGCATSPPFQDIAFTASGSQSLSPLKVVRHEVPIATKVARGQMAMPVLFGPLGALALAAAQQGGGKELMERYRLPDYGELVVEIFVKLAAREVPGWPEMVVEGKPVARDFSYPGALLTVSPGSLIFSTTEDLRGFNAGVVVRLTDPRGNVLWQTQFMYQSKTSGRARDWEEFEADEAKLLKEEMDFAADTTAAYLVRHLKGERKPTLP